MTRSLAIVALGTSILIGLGCNDNDPRAGELPKYGETVAQVEKKLGQPIGVIPQMGNEMRTYKGKSGTRYMITYDSEGKVIEIR